MMTSFDLTREPWVPVSDKAGHRMELGLEEVFLRASALTEVRDESPLVTAALHRLLIVLGHRIVQGPRDEAHWRALWNAGRFEEAAVRTYFERWRDRFDLFSDTYPFWQVAGFAIVDAKTREAKPPLSLSNLVHEAASGNNATLFDHRQDEIPLMLSPATAARSLVAFQFFAIGGGKGATSNHYGEHPYLSHGMAVGDLTVLWHGGSLAQTLLLNLLCQSNWKVPSSGNDALPWEREGRERVGAFVPDGFLDALSYPSRAVRLVTNAASEVTGVYFAQGMSLLKGLEIRSPYAPCYLHAERGLCPISLDPGKALWRDSYSLFVRSLDEERQADPRPLTFVQLAKDLGDALSDENYAELSCSVIGLASDKAKILLWRHEEWPVPKALLLDERTAYRLMQGIEMAEEGGRSLSLSLYKLALYSVAGTSEKKPQESERKNASTLAGRSTYWARLEGPFRLFLKSLGTDVEPAFDTWKDACRREARSAFEETATQLVGRAGRDLKEWVKARHILESGLVRIFGQQGGVS